MHTFDLADGFPTRLVQTSDGTFYGTTTGSKMVGSPNNYGTIYALRGDGALTILHRFDSTDGDGPNSLVQATDGHFWGTTVFGGVYGGGTVFRMTPSGELSTVYNFSGSSVDPAYPWSGLVEGTEGDFYGTTTSGGLYGSGTVFKITPTGVLTTFLYSFSQYGQYGSSNGFGPAAGLVEAADGVLNGCTEYGGTYGNGNGTIFKITKTGELTTLHRFQGTDGQDPFGGLVQVANGSIYGTTLRGGASDYGTLFVLRISGLFRHLHVDGLAL